MSGVYDYAGPSGMLAFALPVHAAFRLAKDVGALTARFRSCIPRPPRPLFTLHCAPHGTQRKTRGRVDRYSFLVRLFHPLLPTGSSRRTSYPLTVAAYGGYIPTKKVETHVPPASQVDNMYRNTVRS